MTKTVWKFLIPGGDEFAIEMPREAEILSVQVQHGAAVMWATVAPDNQLEKRRFVLATTGNPFPKNAGRFVGTIQLADGQFVIHVFEREASR